MARRAGRSALELSGVFGDLEGLREGWIKYDIWFQHLCNHILPIDGPYAWLPECALDIFLSKALIPGLFKHLIKQSF